MNKTLVTESKFVCADFKGATWRSDMCNRTSQTLSDTRLAASLPDTIRNRGVATPQRCDASSVLEEIPQPDSDSDTVCAAHRRSPVGNGLLCVSDSVSNLSCAGARHKTSGRDSSTMLDVSQSDLAVGEGTERDCHNDDSLPLTARIVNYLGEAPVANTLEKTGHTLESELDTSIFGTLDLQASHRGASQNLSCMPCDGVAGDNYEAFYEHLRFNLDQSHGGRNMGFLTHKERVRHGSPALRSAGSSLVGAALSEGRPRSSSVVSNQTLRELRREHQKPSDHHVCTTSPVSQKVSERDRPSTLAMLRSQSRPVG